MPKAESSQDLRRFFLIDFKLDRPDLPGMELLNEDKIKGDQQYFGVAHKLQRGFPTCPELPRFLFDAKLGPPVRDLEGLSDYWLISKRAKAVFEMVDPDAFAFQACEIILSDGSPGPEHWLCDVTRMVDAIDESASLLESKQDRFGRKFYPILGPSKIIMYETLDPALHIFRPRYLEAYPVCDNVMRDVCESSNLTGVGFKDVETIGRG